MGSTVPAATIGGPRIDLRQVRARLRSDGFVVVPGLLPRGEVRQVRSLVADVLRGHDWLAEPASDELRPDTNRRDGSPGWWRMYEDIQRIEALHRLAHHPRLTAVVRGLVGAPLLNHPRRYLTLIPPGFRIPPHQEFLHVQGTPDVIGAWIPIAGGRDLLQILRGARALRQHVRVPGTGGMEAVAGPADQPDWLTVSGLEPGDVVLLHGLTVWGCAENTGAELTGALLARYQSAWQPVCPASLQTHHYPRLPDWTALTRGWKRRTWLRPPWPRRTVPFVLPRDLDRWNESLPAPRPALVDLRPD